MELRRSHINSSVFELDLTSSEAIDLAKALIDSAHTVDTCQTNLDSWSNMDMIYSDAFNNMPAKFLTRVSATKQR